MYLLLVMACKDPEVLAFPEDFQFGSATAGFQVEAGCPTLPAEDCEDRASDWYQWVTDEELIADGGNHLSGDPMSEAPGHYELYDQDLQLAEDMGLTLFRFSFEWSRLFPDGAAEQATTVEDLAALVDPEQLAWYHDYLDSMKSHGLEPVATVNHYTLPLWVHDGKACNADPDTCEASGWLDEQRILPLIELFTTFLAQEFGDDITLWLTLNEPLAVIVSGYLFPSEDRTNPPGISDPDKALTVAWNMAQAHARMSDALHAHDPDADVGVVVNLGITRPSDPDNPLHVTAAENMDYVYNEAILEMFVNGRLDSDLDGEVDLVDDSVAGRTDWLGLNYYFGFEVIGFDGPAPGFGDYPKMTFLPLEFDDDPALLAEAIDMTAEYDLPIWITENGVADPGPEDVEGFLDPSLEIVRQKSEEYDIRGYMYWSLMDNYEWNHGMGMLFGLYEVDLVTKERTLRPIGERYTEIVQNHGFPALDE
jgi:beta-galactosidase